MTDNAELMRLRGEFITLERELKELCSQISSEAISIKLWVEHFIHYGDAMHGNTYDTGHYRSMSDAEINISRIKRIQENHEKADSIRARLKQLKPMTGL